MGISKPIGIALSEWGETLGRKVFGESIPNNVSNLLGKSSDGMSKVDAGIFSRAIDFDPEVREPLDALLRNAADGSDDAYMLLDMAAKQFEVEDQTFRVMNKTQQRLSKQQRKTWNIKSDEIDQAADPKFTGDPGRRVKGDVQTHFTGPKEYTSGTLYRRDGKMVTNRHHAIGLDDANKVVTQHQSYQGVTPDSKSPIIEARERILGVKSGNFEQNMVDILDSVTRTSREARIAAIGDQTGRILDAKTIDDALGTTGSGSKKPYKPRELDPEELTRFETLRQEVPDLTVEDFMANLKTSKGTKFREGQFPDIRVYAPGSKHSGPNKVKAPK